MPLNLSKKFPPPIFKHIQSIDQKIRSIGHTVYLVGGCVRDLALGKDPKDIDLATSATPPEVKSLFSHVIETGIAHGTVTVMLDRIPYEVTTFRTESGYVDGRRPGQVSFSKELSEDLKRRDFTINALAIEIESGNWIDEHNGIADIEAKIVRCVGNPMERFSEDGLRPIRALRFASSLGFQLDVETRTSISKTRSVIQKISIERFLDEIRKSYQGKDPETFVRLLLEEDIFSLFFSNWSNKSNNENFLLALNDLPKTDFPLFLWVLSNGLGHSGKELSAFLKRLKTSNQIEKDCQQFNEIQSVLFQKTLKSDYEVKRFILSPLSKYAHASSSELKSVLERFIPLWENKTWVLPEYRNSSFSNRLSDLLNQNPALTLRDLRINGDLILSNHPNLPKQYLGQILNQLLDYIWQNPEQNALLPLTKQCAIEISNLQLKP